MLKMILDSLKKDEGGKINTFASKNTPKILKIEGKIDIYLILADKL